MTEETVLNMNYRNVLGWLSFLAEKSDVEEKNHKSQMKKKR